MLTRMSSRCFVTSYKLLYSERRNGVTVRAASSRHSLYRAVEVNKKKTKTHGSIPLSQSALIFTRILVTLKHCSDRCSDAEAEPVTLARFLLFASDSIVSVLPIIVTNTASVRNVKSLPWALYIRLDDGRETIMAVSLFTGGSNPNPTSSSHPKHFWSEEADVDTKFGAYLVLSASETQEFSRSKVPLSPASWQLRRYRATVQYAQKLSDVNRSLHTPCETNTMPEKVPQ